MKGEEGMKKPAVPVVVVMICLLCTLCHCLSWAGPSREQTARGKGGTPSRIVIEYVSFSAPVRQYEVYPWETLKLDDFRSAYARMIGQAPLEDWVKTLTGTAVNKNRMIRAFKEQFVLITSCKPHMCDASQIIVLYDPSGKRSFAVFAEDGKFQWLGGPSEQVTDLLKILLVEEFRDAYRAGQ